MKLKIFDIGASYATKYLYIKHLILSSTEKDYFKLYNVKLTDIRKNYSYSLIIA